MTLFSDFLIFLQLSNTFKKDVFTFYLAFLVFWHERCLRCFVNPTIRNGSHSSVRKCEELHICANINKMKYIQPFSMRSIKYKCVSFDVYNTHE